MMLIEICVTSDLKPNKKQDLKTYYTDKKAILSSSGNRKNERDVDHNYRFIKYKFRADYLTRQYWSEIINPQPHHGLAAVNVNDGGNPLGGVNVYVFNPGGSYLGIHDQIDPFGNVSF